MKSPILEICGIGKTFGGLCALRNVDFSVDEGEVVGIMGANGAGKTTLFGLIAGHLTPTEGQIFLDGKNIVGLSPYQICRRGIGRTFQTVKPFAGLTVLENVVLAARFGTLRLGMAQARKQASSVLKAVGLSDRAADAAGALTLSGQKRLEVARAVATGARIVLLDEVMAGLTPNEVAGMLQVIEDLRATYKLTILIIEHVMRALMHISNRIIVLHHGESIAFGTPAVISQDPRVLDCYLGRST